MRESNLMKIENFKSKYPKPWTQSYHHGHDTHSFVSKGKTVDIVELKEYSEALEKDIEILEKLLYEARTQ